MILDNIIEIIFKPLGLSEAFFRSTKYYLLLILVAFLFFIGSWIFGKSTLLGDDVEVWKPGTEKDANVGNNRFEHK